MNQSSGASSRRRRSGGARRLSGVVAALACLAIVLMMPAASQAYTSNYCGVVLAPGSGGCASSWPHSFYHASAYYPGPPAHHVKPCTYMINLSNGNIRGNWVSCRWSENGYAAVSFDATFTAQYRAFTYLDIATCCNHTINSWATTTT